MAWKSTEYSLFSLVRKSAEMLSKETFLSDFQRLCGHLPNFWPSIFHSFLRLEKIWRHQSSDFPLHFGTDAYRISTFEHQNRYDLQILHHERDFFFFNFTRMKKIFIAAWWIARYPNLRSRRQQNDWITLEKNFSNLVFKNPSEVQDADYVPVHTLLLDRNIICTL